MIAMSIEPMTSAGLAPELLARLENDLVAQRDELAARLSAATTTATGDFADPDSVTERHASSALAQQTAEALDTVQRALARMDDGSYGVCVSCQQSIPNERLEAIPQAESCVACSASGRSMVG